MALLSVKLLRIGVTVIAVPTFAEAKLPVLTVPPIVTVSEPRIPTAVGVPEITAVSVESYALFEAAKPLIVIGAAVITPFVPEILPEVYR